MSLAREHPSKYENDALRVCSGSRLELHCKQLVSSIPQLDRRHSVSLP